MSAIVLRQMRRSGTSPVVSMNGALMRQERICHGWPSERSSWTENLFLKESDVDFRMEIW
jgi:hypothetical protein